MRTRSFLLLLLPLLIGSCSYLPEKQEPSSAVTIYDYREYIEINPTINNYSKTGLVFYPGGLVDPHSYIEPLSKFAISGKGHKIIIVKMPGNLAILDSNQGAWIFNDFPDVEQWVVAGHSLGGVMACSLVEKYPSFFVGMVLMAAYPQKSASLKDWPNPVLSLRGEHDLLVDSLKLASFKDYLPEPFYLKTPDDMPLDRKARTDYYTIPGGNHSQFGNYGMQKGDGTATITKDQQAETVAFMILKFFISNSWEYDN